MSSSSLVSLPEKEPVALRSHLCEIGSCSRLEREPIRVCAPERSLRCCKAELALPVRGVSGVRGPRPDVAYLPERGIGDVKADHGIDLCCTEEGRTIDDGHVLRMEPNAQTVAHVKGVFWNPNGPKQRIDAAVKVVFLIARTGRKEVQSY